jgi:integrase
MYTYDSNGICHRKRKYVPLGFINQFDGSKMTRREAEAQLEPYVAQANASAIAPFIEEKRITFEAFSKIWERDYLSLSKPSHQATAKGHLKKLIAAFGQKGMRQIGASDMQRLISEMSSEGYAAKTIKNLWSTMRSIWGAGVNQGYVDQQLTKPRLPRATHTSARCFCLDEVARIIAAGRDFPPPTIMYWLAAETGLRAGELFGLRVADVDIDRIYVRKSVWHGKVDSPKTPSSVRTVAISRQLTRLLEMLWRLRMEQGGEYLFSSSGTTPSDVGNERRRHLQPLLKRLGIAPAGFHAFRHFNASELSRLRVPLKTIQERLGHASTGSLTLDVYTHSEWGENADAAELLGDRIEKAVNSCSLTAAKASRVAAD